MKNIELCVVIPAYNEAECIEKVVRSWVDQLKKDIGENLFKVLIVNDGSKDSTGTILDSLKIQIPELIVLHKPNGGHGDALYVGYKAALETDSNYIFQTDSDDQFKPIDFIKLWEKRNLSHAIFGFRQNRHDPLHRLVITRILRFLLFFIYGAYIKDSNVPFRLFQRKYFDRIFRAIPQGAFAPNIFITVLSVRDGQKPFFIPITHEERQTGVISIVRWKLIKVCMRSAKELILFRLSLSQRLLMLRA